MEVPAMMREVTGCCGYISNICGSLLSCPRVLSLVTHLLLPFVKGVGGGVLSSRSDQS